MIYIIQVGYKNFNLSEQVFTYILTSVKVSQFLSRVTKMRSFSKIAPPNLHKQSLNNIYGTIIRM